MIGIDIEMPKNCRIGKRTNCPLLNENFDCNLLPESSRYDTFSEQFEHCPLSDLDRQEDDLK